MTTLKRATILDVETFLMRRGLKVPKPVAVGYYTGEDDPEGPDDIRIFHCLYDAAALVETIVADLNDPECLIVNQNIAFDLAVLCNEFPTLLPHVFRALDEGRVADTMLREMLLRIAHGTFKYDIDDDGKTVGVRYGLDSLVRTYLNLDISDAKDGATRRSYATMFHLPVAQWPHEFREYLKSDIILTWRVFWEQCDAVMAPLANGTPAGHDALGVPRVQHEEETVDSQFTLQVMSSKGLRRDVAHVDWLEKKIIETLDTIDAEIFRREGPLPEGLKTLRRDGSRNMKAIGARLASFYERAGTEPIVTEKSKPEDPTYASGADILATTDDAILRLLAARASTRTELTKDVPLLRNAQDYPLTYNARTPAITGRVATTQPNVQNLARKPGVREAFVPRDGHVFCSVDYDTLEVRAWGSAVRNILGYSTAADMYDANPDFDPHGFFGAAILGVPYEGLKADLKDKTREGYKAAKNARQMAKAFVFGRPGGMGVERLVESAKGYGIELTVGEAEANKALWHEVFPEGWDFFGWVKEQVDSHGVINLWWTHGMIKGGAEFCDACNFTFQGPAAQGSKRAGSALLRATFDENSPLFRSYPVIMAHDEWIYEVPEEHAHEAALEIQRIMVEQMEGTLQVPIRASPALCRRWYKAAEAVYDSNGRLIPWEPPADYWAAREFDLEKTLKGAK